MNEKVQLTPEAKALKQQYNRKYQNRYWNKKAEEAKQQEPVKESSKNTVSVTRGKLTDEAYIKALEASNKTLGSENRRLVSELIKIKTFLSEYNLNIPQQQ